MIMSRWALFAVMAVAQLAVPFSMIYQREQILSQGAPYKFRCGPVDPYDAFRGRYVALTLLDTTLEHWKGEPFNGDRPVYALLGLDEQGFAKIADVRYTKPGSGDYLRVTAYAFGGDDISLQVTLPFDRYYMDEFQAPAAEIAYRNEARSEEGAHVVVRVRKGEGVIEGLYLGDTPIEEYLLQEAAKAGESP
ncbi:MAG: GDYXXLXY domain-containing protein [Candidatus Hydrogenedentes bacterium]|nr:GDYXXLXY domain-containing protein [Candidatus Hydrogenedentota bacterium]